MVTVEIASSEVQIRRYMEFTASLYQGNPNWRPQDEHHFTTLMAGRTPFAAHTRVQPFLAVKDGRIQAVVAAVVDDLFNRHWNQQAGHLFYFEAAAGAGAESQSVIEAACQWLKSQGCHFARFGFLYAWQLGFLIDAYQHPPTLFHNYNPPYYHGLIKDCGFVTEQGLIEYRVDFTPELRARYEGFAQLPGINLRRLRAQEIEADTRVFCALYNETFARHWGAPQFTYEEMLGLTAGFGDLLDPNLIWIAEDGDLPAGIVYSLPDLHQTPDISHGLLLCIGVKESHRGRGVNLALAARSYLAMIDKGYRSASYSVVLDTNRPSRRTAEKLGCHAARNFAVYRRDFA